MIDLDKYKGHTEGPWEYNTDDDGWTLAAIHERNDPDRDEFIVLITRPNGDPNLTMNPDLKLIADAPLLLAEIKRLRKAIKKWEDDWCRLGDYISHYDKEMYEAIDEDIGWEDEPYKYGDGD